ncbi:MAG: DNA polymerase III subunit gamma/tau [Cyanobacteria bacterium P01_A01_bin.123]
MSYEPLHHKYRPQTFAHLVGQGAIAATLSNALRQNRIAPAYLFSGPRGTGKTSSARILAKSLNCLETDGPTPDPCGVCDICQSITRGTALDVIEIDAASNTGVDNIRELIERAQFAPVQCRHKVYVIDECHMLSTAAFNALLKTLEEPPEQVVFVLATTDPQRVLPTIVSRCQRFDFRRIPLEDMVVHLTAIAKTEAIAIHPDALRLVAQMSQGGLRDAESLLDQLSLLEGEVIIERVWELVGAVPERDLLGLVEAIAQDDSATVLDQARHLMNRGREPLMVLQSLAGFYRDLIIAKTAPDRADLVAITPSTWQAMTDFVAAMALPTLLLGQQHLRAAEVQIKNTTQPRLWLEVTLLGLLPAALSSQQRLNQPAQSIPSQSIRGAAVQTQTAAPKAVSPNRSLADSSAEAAQAPLEEKARGAPELIPPRVESSEVLSSDDATQSEAAESEAAESKADATPAADVTNPTGASQQNTENLSEIWCQIVATLQPLGTRALMQQQGRLLSFADNQAQVGISSQPLFRMAKQRLPNVETAFKQVFGREIKVSFEIATLPESTPASGSDPNLGNGSSNGSSNGPSPEALSNPDALPPAPPNPTGLPPQPPIAQNLPPAIPPPPSNANSPPTAMNGTHGGGLSSSPVAGENGATWRSESDLDRAVKSFAQFFNGQVVNLDDEIDPESSNGNGAGHIRDRDVPF